MKGKAVLIITIGLVCVIFTALIFVQMKTVSQTDIIALENMKESELKTEISSWKTKNEETLKKLEETKLKIEEYNQKVVDSKEVSKLLQKELKQNNDLIGKNDVTGDGVIITLTDTTNAKIIAFDLMLLLNELKAAGAEAISINNQRIIFNSYVVDINNTYISVNGAKLVSPFEVKAIGNTTYLESGLSKKQYGYIDSRITEGKDVKLKKQTNITINKYNDDINLKYIKGE